MMQSDKNSLSEPIVSVCCLAYNHEKTIADAIEGIVSQKAPFKFELIIHDDASTDKTAEIIKDYAARYPDIIKPILQTENQYYNCNLAKEFLMPNVSPSSKYIAICEGDDYWSDSGKLALQVEAMRENPERTLCFHAVNQLNPSGEFEICRPLKKSGDVSADLIIKRGGMFCPSVSLLFRRDIADMWPDFRCKADVYDYPLQILAAISGKAYYIDKIMGVYRFAGDNSWTAEHSGSSDNKHIENEKNWLEMFNRYSQNKYSYAVNYHLAHFSLCEYRKSFDKRFKTECRQYAKKLGFSDKAVFSILILFFSLFGKTANKIWNIFKKHFLK